MINDSKELMHINARQGRICLVLCVQHVHIPQIHTTNLLILHTQVMYPKYGPNYMKTTHTTKLMHIFYLGRPLAHTTTNSYFQPLDSTHTGNVSKVWAELYENHTHNKADTYFYLSHTRVHTTNLPKTTQGTTHTYI